MSSQDFLHTRAETPLCEHYTAAGAVCSLSTNSTELLEAARDSFAPLESPSRSVDFSLRLWVDAAGVKPPSWPTPYVRGLDHMVFAAFDEGSSVLADLRTRRVIGRFSGAMASDRTHWRAVIFPVVLSIVAGTVGMVELHASCVAEEHQGLILVGPSRSGKSTMAMALREAGLRLLSDDRTFCTLKDGKLLAYGLPRPLKLRRDAACWFDKLRDREPVAVQSGEQVFYQELAQDCGQPVLAPCEPRALVLLDRQESPGFFMAPANASEMRSRIESDLLAETPDVIQKQQHVLDTLMAIPCWQLRYNGQPQIIARKLLDHLASSSGLND